MFSLSIMTFRSLRTYLCFSLICFLFVLANDLYYKNYNWARDFSLQAIFNKYENCAIWIPENVYYFFHLVLYII